MISSHLIIFVKTESVKNRFFYLLFILFTLVSCKSIIDTYYENREREKYVSAYAGTYIGTYSGATDRGTLKVTVSEKDYVKAERFSEVNQKSEILEGGMSGPSFQNVKSRESGFTIFGNLQSRTKTFTGTWSQAGLGGDWALVKQ